MRAQRYNANEHVSWQNIVTKNFVGGIMWGLGTVIGASFVLSLFMGTLRRLDFIPVVADFVLQVQNVIDTKR